MQIICDDWVIFSYVLGIYFKIMYVFLAYVEQAMSIFHYQNKNELVSLLEH